MNTIVFEPMDMAVAESLLKEAKGILDRLGIVFFLRHGTCLGAVRDQAFIAWDDDLDLGSVIGMHGLTDERVRMAAAEFGRHGFAVNVIDSDLHLSVDLNKDGTQMDWTCYRIIGDSIYQWPAVKIPARLYEHPQEIEFLDTTFMVPNPSEEYLRLKYGPDWMTPKRVGDFEQDVLDLMGEAGDADGILNLSGIHDPNKHTGSLKVTDENGQVVSGAAVSLAATTVMSGLSTAHTNTEGCVYFSLPETASYVVAVTIEDRSEVLYLEELAPGIDYLYRPDPEHPSGRVNALIAR